MEDIEAALTADGFSQAGVMRQVGANEFTMSFTAFGQSADNVIYVATQENNLLYVGQARRFSSRYDKRHMTKWLPGLLGNSEQQRVRWVERLRMGPIMFFAKSFDGNLDRHEEEWMQRLDPLLNVAGRRWRLILDVGPEVADAQKSAGQGHSTAAIAKSSYSDIKKFWAAYWSRFLQSYLEIAPDVVAPTKKDRYYLEFPTSRRRWLFAVRGRTQSPRLVAAEFFAEFRTSEEAKELHDDLALALGRIRVSHPLILRLQEGACRVRVESVLDEVDVTNETDWSRQHGWLTSVLQEMRSKLGPIVERLLEDKR